MAKKTRATGIVYSKSSSSFIQGLLSFISKI